MRAVGACMRAFWRWAASALVAEEFIQFEFVVIVIIHRTLRANTNTHVRRHSAATLLRFHASLSATHTRHTHTTTAAAAAVRICTKIDNVPVRSVSVCVLWSLPTCDM